MTLRDKVLSASMFDCRKHDLHRDPEYYAEKQLDKLTNSEFLQALSDALEEMEAERNGKS
jgi:hypothetical protein